MQHNDFAHMLWSPGVDCSQLPTEEEALLLLSSGLAGVSMGSEITAAGKTRIVKKW